MEKQILINVDTNRDMNHLKDGDILAFNPFSHNYYITTRDSILREQNDKIKQLEVIIEEKTKEIEKYKAETTEIINNFLATYKETNAKMINMIKEMSED